MTPGSEPNEYQPPGVVPRRGVVVGNDATRVSWRTIMSNGFTSHYRPAQGGHAPSDVRDSFQEAVEAISTWPPGSPEPWVELRAEQVPAAYVCGLLWNCTDQMPGDLVRSVVSLAPDCRGSTYACAARSLKPIIRRG